MSTSQSVSLYIYQQFITWSMMADYGSHFVTTLNRTKKK